MKTLTLILIVLVSSFGLISCAKNQAQQNDPVKIAQQAKPSEVKIANYCNAITKKGLPCRRRVKKAGDHCFLHGGK